MLSVYLEQRKIVSNESSIERVGYNSHRAISGVNPRCDELASSGNKTSARKVRADRTASFDHALSPKAYRDLAILRINARTNCFPRPFE